MSTKGEVEDAIDDAKDYVLSGTGVKNPNIVVDLDTGEIYQQGPNGTHGDSIGNIFD